MASTLKAETAWVNPHEPAAYEFGRIYDIDQAWVTSLFNFQMVLPCFFGYIDISWQRNSKKTWHCKAWSGPWKIWISGVWWKRLGRGWLVTWGRPFFSPCKIGRWRGYRRAGWGFSLICGLSQDKWPSKMGTYHWEGHQVFLMHICRVQSQVPFSGVCAHLRDLEKNGTGTYHWEVTGICVQTSEAMENHHFFDTR